MSFVRRSASVLRPVVRQARAQPSSTLVKSFGTARLARADEDVQSPGPLLVLTEEEEMMRESGTLRVSLNNSHTDEISGKVCQGCCRTKSARDG